MEINHRFGRSPFGKMLLFFTTILRSIVDRRTYRNDEMVRASQCSNVLVISDFDARKGDDPVETITIVRHSSAVYETRRSLTFIAYQGTKVDPEESHA